MGGAGDSWCRRAWPRGRGSGSAGGHRGLCGVALGGGGDGHVHRFLLMDPLRGCMVLGHGFLLVVASEVAGLKVLTSSMVSKASTQRGQLI